MYSLNVRLPCAKNGVIFWVYIGLQRDAQAVIDYVSCHERLSKLPIVSLAGVKLAVFPQKTEKVGLTLHFLDCIRTLFRRCSRYRRHKSQPTQGKQKNALKLTPLLTRTHKTGHSPHPRKHIHIHPRHRPRLAHHRPPLLRLHTTLELGS